MEHQEVNKEDLDLLWNIYDELPRHSIKAYKIRSLIRKLAPTCSPCQQRLEREDKLDAQFKTKQ